LIEPARVRRGRKRQIAGVLLLTLGLLNAGIWGASRRWWFGYNGVTWQVSLQAGVVSFVRPKGRLPLTTMEEGWHSRFIADDRPEWSWLADRYESPPTLSVGVAAVYTLAGGRAASVDACGWLFALPPLVGGAVLMWSTRWRARKGKCVECGYDLAGLAAGVRCPECGESE